MRPDPLHRPERLRPGDTVGVVSPASPSDSRALAEGIAAIEDLGFRTKLAPGFSSVRGYLAGSDSERCDALVGMIKDPEVKAIFFARGGYGAMRLAAHLDANAVRRSPKIILGYSDITFLHLWLQSEAGLITFHGPLVTEMGGMDPITRKILMRALTDPTPLGPLPAPGARVLRAGTGSGPLVGGSLSLLCHSMGTPWAPDTRGSVLLIEEVGERPYRIDRMLQHLRLAGAFRETSAVIFGSFLDCSEPGWGEEEDRRVLEEIIGEVAEEVPGPVLADFPIGHGPVNLTVPLGARVLVDGSRGTLAVEEPALAS